MTIVEFKSGPIDYRYLMRKTKHDLARFYLDLLAVYERMEKRASEAEDAAWNEAIKAALAKIPGGDVADPQEIADAIQELKR